MILFKRSNPETPVSQPSSAAVEVGAEAGVRLYVAVGEPFDDGEDTPETAALAPPAVTVFAAWPRSWQRLPQSSWLSAAAAS